MVCVKQHMGSQCKLVEFISSMGLCLAIVFQIICAVFSRNNGVPLSDMPKLALIVLVLNTLARRRELSLLQFYFHET